MPRTTQVWSGVGWGGRDSVSVGLAAGKSACRSSLPVFTMETVGVTWWTVFAALAFSVVSSALAVLTVLVLALAWMADRSVFPQPADGLADDLLLADASLG